MALDVRTAMKIYKTKIKAGEFTQKLINRPLAENVNLKQGMMEALFQTMI